LKIPSFEEVLVLNVKLMIDIKNQEEMIQNLQEENFSMQNRLDEITEKYGKLLESKKEEEDGRGNAESED
jgi:hypothetical protein